MGGNFWCRVVCGGYFALLLDAQGTAAYAAFFISIVNIDNNYHFTIDLYKDLINNNNTPSFYGETSNQAFHFKLEGLPIAKGEKATEDISKVINNKEISIYDF